MGLFGRLVVDSVGVLRNVDEVVEEGAPTADTQLACDGAGRLGRALPGLPMWSIPEVTLVGSALRWRWADRQPGTTAPPTPGATGALDEFVRLDGASDDRFLAFAGRWGVLSLCTHLQPYTHNRACSPVGVEPLEVWRVFARDARSIVAAAATLHGDPPVDEMAHRSARISVAERVKAWLAMSPAIVDLHVERPDPKSPHGFSIGIGVGGVFSAIGVQLLMAVLHADGIYTCAGCGRPFAPARRPMAGRDCYCPHCGRRAAMRAADRRRRKHRVT